MDEYCNVLFHEDDGIRYLVRYRELGDVYKWQTNFLEIVVEVAKVISGCNIVATVTVVSYTHLTLPTIYAV